MSNDIFDGQILAEKLLKLNNSQQSIESLSRWCISHRKKAREIVETWEKLFNSSQKEQRVSFLYLANDILQNSRRKGSEFVNEFWKVLPAALRHVYENGDEYGRKAVIRLVDIWEERKVFGSRGQGLKDEMTGKIPFPSSATNGKSSNPIKIVKRDAHSVRIKLAVGGLPEKILTAFQSVLEEHLIEEVALNKCNVVVQHVGRLMEDIENTLSHGNQLGSTVVSDLQDREKELQQYIEQLENAEAARASLLSQLKDALREQESSQEVVRTQLHVARGQIEQAVSLRKTLMMSAPVAGPVNTTTDQAAEVTRILLEQNLPSVQLSSTPSRPLLPQPLLSFAPLKATEEDNKKAAAAAVAAKLTASTSSAQMLTSVLSSLVAEEAASMNGGLNSTGFTSGLPIFNPEKRPKLENPMPVSDGSSSDIGSSSFFQTLQQPSNANLQLSPSTSLQPISQASFAPTAPLPPPPHSPANTPANQYVQSTGLMIVGNPYGYGSNNLPPPPPFPPHVAIGLQRPSSQSSQQSQAQQAQQHPQQQQQQQSAMGGFYRPPGIGFYGQTHPSTPPLPRQ